MTLGASAALADTITFTGAASITSTGFTTSTTGPGSVATGAITSGFGTGSSVHYTVPLLTGSQYAFHDYTGANTPTLLAPVELMTFTAYGNTYDVWITSVVPGAIATSTTAFGSLTANGYFTSTAFAGQIAFNSLTMTSTVKQTGIQPFIGTLNYSTSLTPEPTGLLLLGTGLLAIGFVSRRGLFARSA